MVGCWVGRTILHVGTNSLRIRGAYDSGNHRYSYTHHGPNRRTYIRTNFYSGFDTDGGAHGYSGSYAYSDARPYIEAHTNRPPYADAYAYAAAYD